ncbi:hypothetical protein DFH09DRAFT_1370526, partial [Mycena vulgaris]
MAATATFHNVSLTTAFAQDADKSLLSLDWVMNSGIRTVRSVASGVLTLPAIDGFVSLHMDLPVASSLPFDIVLGRDWLQYCREALPETVIHMSSGLVDLRRPPIVHSTSQSNSVSSYGILDDAAEPEPASHTHDELSDCACSEQSFCRCPSTSSIPMNNMSMNSLNIIRDIFIGHHSTRSRISAFHTDLPVIQHAL